MIGFNCISYTYGQTGSPIAVYDKSKENQMASTVYSQWEFYPKWYYSFFHSKYKKDYGNNDEFLKPLEEHAKRAKKEVVKAHKEINVVYEQEVALWKDRTIDKEYASIEKDFVNIRESIQRETAKFEKNKVSVNNASAIYDELERIDQCIAIIRKAHLENEKRQKAYSALEEEYKNLYRRCARMNGIHEARNKYK